MTTPDGRDGPDLQRRAEERAKGTSRPAEPVVHCTCYGSMFSHDVDCALELARYKAAGYRLVRDE